MAFKESSATSMSPPSVRSGRMAAVPPVHDVLRAWPGVGPLLLGCCSLLSACGGADGNAVGQPAVAPAPAAATARMQAATPATLHAIAGQGMVTLNALPPLAPDAAASAATVAVRRSSAGDMVLVQRDGGTRTVSPDGRLTLQPAGAPGQPPADLPPSVMVAVDASNTVHVVDPQACIARRIAPDGRVTTVVLPAPAGQSCAAAAPAH